MAKKHGMLVTMDKCIERFAGRSARDEVMKGSEGISERTDKKRIAKFLQGTMSRMDDLVDEKVRAEIMENCGFECARQHGAMIRRALAKRRKFKTTDEYLDAEQRKPTRGTRLVRKGDVLHQIYTPLTYSKSMRCYCSLLRGLPPQETISPTYCQCSKGFVRKFWEGVLERPVRVELLRSAVSGAKECEFAIHLK